MTNIQTRRVGGGLCLIGDASQNLAVRFVAEVLRPQIQARVYCPSLPVLPENPVGRLSPTTSLHLCWTSVLCNHVCVALVAHSRVSALGMSKPIMGNKPCFCFCFCFYFSELSRQGCHFQEGYLRIFSVTLLQITCTCFPARVLVAVVFQQLSWKLIAGRNTKLPTTLRACNSRSGKCFVVRQKRHQQAGVATTTQRPRYQAKPLLCHDHNAFFVVSKSVIHTNATRSPGPSSIRRNGTSGGIQEVQQRQERGRSARKGKSKR